MCQRKRVPGCEMESVAVAPGRAGSWDPRVSVATTQTHMCMEIMRWEGGDLPAQAERAE